MTKQEHQLQELRNFRDGISTADALACLKRILAAEDDPPEPEIKRGELVRGWIGGGVFIGTFLRRSSTGRYGIDPGDGRECYVDRIERFYMPFDWERWPNAQWVVDFDDSTRVVYRREDCPWDLDGHEKDGNGARVVCILKRPEGR